MATNRTNSMGARDGRTLDHQTLEQLRLRAVAAIPGELKNGARRGW